MRHFFKRRLSLGMVMVIFVFLILLVTMLIMGVGMLVLVRVFGFNPFHGPNPFWPLSAMLLISIVLGTGLTAVVGRRTLRPLRNIINATHKVAAGDFTVQIETDSVPEIEDLTTSFNTMVQELASIETLRSDFVSNFSHEFKTPIVSIRGFAKLLRNKQLPQAERDEYVEIIIQESERLAGLATNVLDLSRLDNTGILTGQEAFFVDEQIRRVAALMEPRWSEKNITLALDMDSVTVYSDEDMLQQVWVNLLDNAIKFTEPGGHIALTLKRSSQAVVFTLADDGIGMDAQTLAHLFDRFYQGDKSHSGSGNGLGLALVKRIVYLCGGSITVQSQPGQGSLFTVTLPVGKAGGPAAAGNAHQTHTNC